MTLQERVDAAITSKLDQSLEHLQSEIEALGFARLDLSPLQADLTRMIRERFDEDADVQASEGAYLLGSAADLSPLPLARSFACNVVREWIGDLHEAIGALEKAEDSKLSQWAKRRFGKEGDIDWKALTILPDDGRSMTVEWLKTIHQVMTYDPERLRAVIRKVRSDSGGQAAFIRDLGNARLSDPRMEKVLNDLLEVTDAEVITQVLESQEVKSHPEFPAISHMAGLLMKRLDLGIDDEEWRKTGGEKNQVEEEPEVVDA